MNRSLILVCLLIASMAVAVRAQQMEYPLVVNYDKFNNVTFIQTDADPVLDATISGRRYFDHNPLKLTIYSGCNGKREACSAPLVTFDFAAFSESWTFIEFHDLTLLADGKRISLAGPEWKGDILSNATVYERVSVEVPVKTLLRLADAKEIEGQLGIVTFTFSEDNKLGIQTIARKIRFGTGNSAALRPAVSHSPDAILLHPDALTAQAPPEFDVKFATTKGDFVIRVTRAWAPLGADRFYNLVKNHFYDAASFFRCVDGFVVQFGLTGNPTVNKVWTDANINDDPVRASNKLGFITFAMAGKNTRTTQVFINLGDNSRLDGMRFAPFGEITSGMDVVKSFYSGYADAPTSHQGEITNQGNAYLQKNFPKLDSIKTATIVSP